MQPRHSGVQAQLVEGLVDLAPFARYGEPGEAQRVGRHRTDNGAVVGIVIGLEEVVLYGLCMERDTDPSPAAGALPGSEPVSRFMRAAAFEPHEVSGTRVTGALELGPEHHTPWGVVHGGVYTTAIETAASIGASVAVRDQGMFAVGLTNTTDFVRPMRHGRVDVVAEPLAQGRTQQLWQVDLVRHDDGKRIAHGKVRLQNVPLESD